MDSSNCTLNFTIRKFLNAEIDPTDEYTIVLTITPPRCVNTASDFLQRIFVLIGNIL